MSASAHPLAIHHLPPFVTAPGETDVLFGLTTVIVLAIILSIGILYFKLHALPEQMAHRGQKVQFELVAVLGLVSLFTHNHAFWIAGLLLAIVPLPDFTTPLSSIANSLERLAAGAPAPVSPPAPPVAPPPPRVHESPTRDKQPEMAKEA